MGGFADSPPGRGAGEPAAATYGDARLLLQRDAINGALQLTLARGDPVTRDLALQLIRYCDEYDVSEAVLMDAIRDAVAGEVPF